MYDVWLSIIVFIAVYLAITFEIINKAVAVLLGVMVLLVFRVVDEHTAIGFIDFETIMLLLGMMAIVAILKKTMLFSFVSIKIAELTQGSPLKILILFSVVTVFLSAFLDNVTTVLIVIPIVIQLTAGMGLDPKIYVISQAVISNIGGTATLIGDPPNIIIGSKVGLTFNQFIFNLATPVLIAMSAAMLFIWMTHREEFKPINTNLTKLFSVQLLLEKIRNEFLNVKIDKMFVCKSLVCLAIAICLFVTQTITRISPGVASIFVAMLLFVISKIDVEQMLKEIEWVTLLFFSGLFALVGVLEEKGVIEWLAHNVFLRVGNNPYLMVLMVLWVSGIASGFLDNVPFTIAMVPVVKLMQESNPIPNNILWWALLLGACFGGNLTMLGASANIVTVGIAKKYKHNISFFEFMRSSALIALITLVISSIYLSIYLWMST
ncbi:MAG: ArsB/NhaD family transporter [Candidatus Scalindua rubra]|uniref:ArsB protein n=1 Tax=Candidatus Scalindua brodae TaxID=237368 RepID=A0A0B0ESC8_9BACT|nr:MAG: ArsB protein [Candidatus Scalindua brodae]MBZ0107829.1 ArsB/NhaD family transporter [Candidatus Scalindua rubra]TWU29206.1 Sodium-dependent dicarboxylate transporter SdcS [Candidatus Brocadiaceae bacterium S225]